jgi:hypothetical protein
MWQATFTFVCHSLSLDATYLVSLPPPHIARPNYLFIVMLIFLFTFPLCLLGPGLNVSAVTGCPDQGLYHFLQATYFHTFSYLFFSLIILRYAAWANETIINETTNKTLVHLRTSSSAFMQYKRYLHFSSKKGAS